MRKALSTLALLWSPPSPPAPSGAGGMLAHIPQYVLDYAPLVHLYSEEKYWPSDIAEHLHHITPNANYTPIEPAIKNLGLQNLNDLNEFDNGFSVYLKSDDDPETYPDWLGSVKNKPDDPGDDHIEWEEASAESPDDSKSWMQTPLNPQIVLQNAQKEHAAAKTSIVPPKSAGGRSSAPVISVVIDKGDGVVDAFWFFFYSFNLGNSFLNVRFGNHVGDWEHTLVRFQHGKPKAIFLSQHSQGDAYTYSAIEKIGKRPVVFSATGTHAMYATPGVHAYAVPFGLLHDVTDRGPLWDPIQNLHAYKYDLHTRQVTAGDITPKAPLEWFYFNGRWGDKVYPWSDKRQYGLMGLLHYVSGPNGPKFKDLSRRRVCQGKQKCVLRNWLPPMFEMMEHEFGSGRDDFLLSMNAGAMKTSVEDVNLADL